MDSIISEIEKLRNNIPIVPDKKNKNKYCIISTDAAYKVAYCFGVPIYRAIDRKLIDFHFRKCNNSWEYDGSNANIKIDKKITMRNFYGEFSIDLLANDSTYEFNKTIHCGKSEISPTLNGLLIKKEWKKDSYAKVKITSSKPFLPCWANDRCFCFMRSDFEPIFSLSCIGASIDSRTISNSIKMKHTKLNDHEYLVEFFNPNPMARYILFETNLYENKLLQDTTVESANPYMNNVYGSTAFIGTTEAFGEQWLYARINYTLISEFYNRKIEKVIMHLPVHNNYMPDLNIYTVSNRFCSFGSNWDNKISEEKQIENPYKSNGYVSFDISKQIVDSTTKYLKKTEGFIIKPKKRDCGFTVLSTGDSFYAPVILEIRYR